MKKKAILIVTIVIPILLLGFYLKKPSEKVVKEVMKEHLLKEYGEEFEVFRLGTRERNGKLRYVAQILPKKFIGTNKEDDEYYEATATAEPIGFGRAGEVGDSFSYVNIKMEAEEYLLPKIKEIFGEKFIFISEINFEKELSDKENYMPGMKKESWFGYKEKSFKAALEMVKENPEENRFQCKLNLYIFDRIDDEIEKEKRKKNSEQLFIYLKKEGLSNSYISQYYIDELVLVPKYKEYEKELKYYKKDIDKNSYFKIKKSLENEYKKISNSEILESISSKKKSELKKPYNGYFESAYCYVDNSPFKRRRSEKVSFSLSKDSLYNKYVYKKRSK